MGKSLVAVAPVPEGLWHGGGFRAKGPFDISLGHRPGTAPGNVTPPNHSRAPTARFIAFDKYVLGAAMSCSGNLARAFSPQFVFRFITWGFAPGWFEYAPLALTAEIEPLWRPELGIRTHF